MTTQLITKNLLLRFPVQEDAFALKEFEQRNFQHLSKWETLKQLNDEEYKNRLKDWIKECQEKRSARFFIFLKDQQHQLIGMCHFTQIFYGPFQACYLGYKIDQEHEGKGFMSEALQSSIGYVFEGLRIHRIMSNYMPINKRSAHLLNRLGFKIEGYAKDYLLIKDQWEDHILTSLSYERWKKHPIIPSPLPQRKTFHIREARFNDLNHIINLLFDDELGRMREDHLTSPSARYAEAFSKICADPNSELIVGELDGKVIGILQITYLYHLTFKGSLVAHIEGVRIHKEYQNLGYGKQMFQWVIERANMRGCQRVQLMTDKRRHLARQFYERLGFSATHEGMKLFIGEKNS